MCPVPGVCLRCEEVCWCAEHVRGVSRRVGMSWGVWDGEGIGVFGSLGGLQWECLCCGGKALWGMRVYVLARGVSWKCGNGHKYRRCKVCREMRDWGPLNSIRCRVWRPVQRYCVGCSADMYPYTNMTKPIQTTGLGLCILCDFFQFRWPLSLYWKTSRTNGVNKIFVCILTKAKSLYLHFLKVQYSEGNFSMFLSCYYHWLPLPMPIYVKIQNSESRKGERDV